ncbi:MAG: FliH/SctL family protein [Candidatus Marinimicrobia bacterium]|nr:FliH/SctL family protein [Candidatus Neomarinimicrobiota bacterium]
MTLKRPLKGVQPLLAQLDDELSDDQQDHEMARIFGEDLNEESRDHEMRAYVDRIKLLEAELQRARTEAYQAGFQEGQNLAKIEARKQYAQLTKEFGDNISSLNTEFQETLEKLSEPLLSLALGTAEKLIQRELTLDNNSNEILRSQLQRVLNETITQTQTIVQVNTTQLEWITGADILRSLNISQNHNLRFIPNPQLQPGECKIETEDFLVDSTIKTQLENLGKMLKDSDATDLR